MLRAILPVATYGAEIGGLARRHILGLRTTIRQALGRGARWRRAAELEIAIDLATVRLWQKAVRRSPAVWDRTLACWEEAAGQ